MPHVGGTGYLGAHVASIEQRASGSWSVYWRNQGRTGKQRVTVGADAEPLAVRILSFVNARRNKVAADEVERFFGLLVDVDEDGSVTEAAPTVREWSVRWLETRTRIGGATKADYRSKLNNVILPAIGDQRLDQVRGSHITDILLGILGRESGNKRKTADRYYEVLRSLFRFAVSEERITRNPVADCDWVHGMVEEDEIEDYDDGHIYLAKTEFHLLRKAMKPDVLLFVDYLAATGCRYSEATALQVQDLNLEKLRVDVKRAWKKRENGTWFVGGPKSKKGRLLDLGSHLAEQLKERVDGRAPDALVFPAPRGGAWRNTNFRARRWIPAVAAAQRCPEHPPEPPVKGRTGPARAFRPDEISSCDCKGRLQVWPTPHDLRHSYTAWQIAAGKPIAAISKSLGHATISVTEHIYAGILPEVRQSLAEVTDAILIPD